MKNAAQISSRVSEETPQPAAFSRAGVAQFVRSYTDAPYPEEKATGHSSRVLLLQGPVGPFFSHLQSYLDNAGYEAWRVIFNAGDRAFCGQKKRITFGGSFDEWRQWVRSFLTTYRPDFVVLFGSERPVHIIAREEAAALDVQVISLEEGYIRPGYVTIEEGANNWLSPLAGQLPPSSFDENALPRGDRPSFNSTSSMFWYGGLYYTVRTILDGDQQRPLYHRSINPIEELWNWPRNLVRRLKSKRTNHAVVDNLMTEQKGKYFLVPLQVPSDTQLGDASLGWSNMRLALESLTSFARSADPDQRLVFKVHPMERGHTNDPAFITNIADELGIGDRVDVIDDGPLAPLTHHSAGMITINSTSGLSAIHHGVPLMVIGRAIYAHGALATCANGDPDFDAFWHNRHVADAALRRRYLAFLRESCLKPGNFYVRHGMLLSCEGIADKMREMKAQKITQMPSLLPLENIA